MSQYTKSTNFATKDNLSPGDPLKIVRGTEIDTEFNNISTAISTKTDNSAAAITGGSITGITDLAVADGGTGASTATAALNNLLPSQTGNSSKYLQTDGTNATWDAISINTGDITGTLPVANGGTGITSFGTGIATFLGTPSSANLASAVTDETGSGALVFANTPTLVAPILGTPTSGNFSSGSFTWPTFNQNTTGTAAGLSATLAIASGGTGQTTANAAFNALAPSQTSASGKYLKSDGTNTSWDALDISTADITGTLPVANGGTGVTSSTGTGNVVLSNSPTLVTPILGTPQSGNFSTGTFTWPTFNQNTTGTAAGLSATLATTSGGTGLTSFTSGGVVYASSSSALATGSALTFDGTNFASTGIITSTNANGLRAQYPSSASFYGQLDARDGNTFLSAVGSTAAIVFRATNGPGTTAEGMRLTSVGLGIGESAPAQSLHVKTATSSTPITLGVLSNATGLPALSFNGAYASTTMAGIYGNGATASNLYYTVPAGQNHYFGIADSTKLTLNSDGNLGLGVTPSAWSVAKAIEIAGGSLISFGTGGLELWHNSFYNGSNSVYKNNGFASTYIQTSGQHRWSTAASGTAGNAISFNQEMTLDASGNLLVGRTTQAAGEKLSVKGEIRAGNAAGNNTLFLGIDTSNAYIGTSASGFGLKFEVDNSERARIDSSGNLLVGKTASSFGTAGIEINAGGGNSCRVTRDGGGLADFNRLSDDGELLGFWQDTNKEGSITVSGSTVSYNGGHLSRWSQWQNQTGKPEVYRGSVLESTNDMCEWNQANEQSTKTIVSTTAKSKAVAGVFDMYDTDDKDSPYDFYVAQSGDFVIRIAQGVVVVNGDLLESAGDGTARPQTDDICRSSTVAKVTSNHITCTYADGSYCVPCVLMAC